MKNRLQFRYNDTLWATREDAVNYIDKYFSTDKYNGGLGNPSLKSEPLVLFYGPTPKESNVILAIGREGDGNDKFSNASYFIIDFAEHTYEIGDIKGYIKDLESSLSDITNTVENNLQELIDLISNSVNEEKERATKAEEELLKTINLEIVRAQEIESSLSERIDAEEQKSGELQELITTEINDRIKGDNELEVKITETDESLNNKIDNEIHNLTDNIQKTNTELNSYIKDVEVKLNNEIKRSEEADDRFNANFEKAHSIELKHSEDITRLDTEVKTLQNVVKQNKVNSSDKTININATENGTDITVNIDNDTITNNNGKLCVNSNAFVKYKGNNAIEVTTEDDTNKTISLKINDKDNVLTNDYNGLATNLRLSLNQQELILFGNNDKVISTVDVSDLIADGMIEKVEVVDNKIVFTFNTSGGGGEISIPFQDLFSLYTADNGINIKDSNISIKKSEKDEGFLQLDGSGLYIKGINQAIADKAELLSKDIEKNLDAIETLEGNILKLESDLRKEYEDADTSVKSELNKEITTTKELLQEQINSKVLEEQRRAELKESDLSNQIDTNRTNIETLQGDVKKDGSVKDVIFKSIIGQIVTNIDVDSAINQSLITKVDKDGTPYFYVSNNTDNMKYKNNSLTNVIDDLKLEDSNININVNNIQGDIKILQDSINRLQTDVTKLIGDLSVLRSEFDNLSKNAITSIEGTSQEIKVIPTKDNSVQIGFADDAEFIAG